MSVIGSSPPVVTGGGGTSGGSTTPVGGVVAQTVVVQLKPVSFQISLHYMGHDRIAHAPNTYRCKYELLKEGAVPAPAFTPVAAATAGSFVTVSPSPPVAGQEVTIEYKPLGGPLDGKPQVSIHYGFNNWATVVAPDAPMASALGVGWRLKFKVPEDAQQIDMAFSDAGSIWHNNNFADWHFPTRGAEPCRANPATTTQAATQVIANVVRHDPPLNPIPNAAKPTASGGDASNPAGEEIFRLQILDNHGMRASVETTAGSIKPARYLANGWMPAVSPAVPFRVVVRKFMGTPGVDLEEKDVSEDLTLVIEVKDPREEFDQNCGARRAFHEKFFTKHNGAAGGSASAGEDNATDAFGGQRRAADSPGVKTSRYIKTAPYNNTPVAAEAATGTGSVTFASLGAPTEDGKRVTIPITRQTIPATGSGTARTVGVSDFAFCPPPIGGDNFRMLLSVKGGVGDAPDPAKDIRDQDANGARVKFLDDQQKAIPVAAAYTTGRFVIWRKVEFALQVCVNGVAANLVDWDLVKETYRRSFLEVVPPARVENVDRAEWIQAMKTCGHFIPADTFFTQAGGVLDTRFSQAFIPGKRGTGANKKKFKLWGGDRWNLLDNDGSPDAAVHALAKKCLELVCTRLGVNFPYPIGNNQQSNPNGLYIVSALCTLTNTAASPDEGIDDGTLGEYIGDRFFYSFPPNAQRATRNIAHELGHTLYLSHSYTTAKAVSHVPAVGAAQQIHLANITSGTANDHDQEDAGPCLMGYLSGNYLSLVRSYPCGICDFVLRFYDKSQIVSAPVWGDEQLGAVAPDLILHWDHAGGKVQETIPSVSVGADKWLVAAGVLRNLKKQDATLMPTRIAIAKKATWAQAGAPIAPVGPNPGVAAGAVTLAAPETKAGVDVVKITGQTAGRVKIDCAYGGVTKSVFVTVVP